uniref:Si:ch211-171h4.3 n=1 Tax=Gasterosteus aculeatus aculeatus TaxID=481459 RepID=G3P412_GASAC
STLAPGELLDEMCHLAAQSLTAMDTSEHFRVVKLLGEGSYGKVMLAVHRQRGVQPLAVLLHHSSSPGAGDRYSRVHYVFAQQAVGMAEDSCQRVVSQLCGALSHLHSLGFVHRDLKPENVFLCDSACRWVKLGDFGMAAGTKVPEVWYSSPYCTPESEVARGNEDSWSAGIWVSVEPSTDTWALGVLTYAMLTGAHPWAETAGDCQSYLRYREWSDGAKGPDDELDVWAEPQGKGGLVEEGPPVAPQFACFTPLACRFFRTLLDPRPRLRGRPEVALNYLGGVWVLEKERARLEEERKKSGGKVAIRSMKEKEGRGER